MWVTLTLFIHFFSWVRVFPVGSGDPGTVLFPSSGSSLGPAVKPRCLLISESGPDPSRLGGLPVKATVPSLLVETPGNTFFFSPTGGFFGAPGPTFLAPGPSLVVLKWKGFGDFGFLDNGGFVTVTECLTEPASLPCVLLSCCSET